MALTRVREMDTRRGGDIRHAVETVRRDHRLRPRRQAGRAGPPLGEFLKVAPKNVGMKGSVVTSSGREGLKDTTPTFADAGLTKKESFTAVSRAWHNMTWSRGSNGSRTEY